jgi:hypothetical protein
VLKPAAAGLGIQLSQRFHPNASLRAGASRVRQNYSTHRFGKPEIRAMRGFLLDKRPVGRLEIRAACTAPRTHFSRNPKGFAPRRIWSATGVAIRINGRTL